MVYEKDDRTLKLNLSKVLPLCNQRLRKKNAFWKVSNLGSVIKLVSIYNNGSKFMESRYFSPKRYISEMFETISSGIDALFDRMGCDRESITKRLGNSSKVDNENILDFLLKIENQSNVLIRIFLTSQQDTIEVRKPVR